MKGYLSEKIKIVGKDERKDTDEGRDGKSSKTLIHIHLSSVNEKNVSTFFLATIMPECVCFNFDVIEEIHT